MCGVGLLVSGGIVLMVRSLCEPTENAPLFSVDRLGRLDLLWGRVASVLRIAMDLSIACSSVSCLAIDSSMVLFFWIMLIGSLLVLIESSAGFLTFPYLLLEIPITIYIKPQDNKVC